MDQSEIQPIAQDVGRRLAAELLECEATQQWQRVAAAMDSALNQLAATECWGEPNRLPSSVFWREAGEVLKHGSLQAHARFKPHGYAGDYEMLERLVRRDCRGEGLAWAFDRYFQAHGAPQAVRNRTRWIAERIGQHAERRPGAKVISIGSEPAADIDLSLTIAEPAHTIHAVLLDLDPHALEFARQRLAPRLPAAQLDCRRENLYRLPRRDPGLLGPPAELVFCTGLFDYLAEADAVSLLQWMLRCAAGDGEVVVMNFSPLNSTRAYMEWAGNWYLIHRTADDMARLAELAGLADSQWTLETEPLGIDWIIRTPGQGS